MNQRNKRRRLAEGEQYVMVGEREFHVENICFSPSNGSLAMMVDTTRLVQRGSSGHVWIETLRGVEFYPKTLADGKKPVLGIAGDYVRARDNAVQETLHAIATQSPILMGSRMRDGGVFQGVNPETGEPLYTLSAKELKPIEVKPVETISAIESKGIIEAYLSTPGKLRAAVESGDPAVRAAFKAIRADAVVVNDKIGTLLVSREDAPSMRNPRQVEEYLVGLKTYAHPDAHISAIDELKALWRHRNQKTLQGTFNEEAFYLSSTAVQSNSALGVRFADGKDGDLNTFGPYQRRAVLTASIKPET